MATSITVSRRRGFAAVAVASARGARDRDGRGLAALRGGGRCAATRACDRGADARVSRRADAGRVWTVGRGERGRFVGVIERGELGADRLRAAAGEEADHEVGFRRPIDAAAAGPDARSNSRVRSQRGLRVLPRLGRVR